MPEKDVTLPPISARDVYRVQQFSDWLLGRLGPESHKVYLQRLLKLSPSLDPVAIRSTLDAMPPSGRRNLSPPANALFAFLGLPQAQRARRVSRHTPAAEIIRNSLSALPDASKTKAEKTAFEEWLGGMPWIFQGEPEPSRAVVEQALRLIPGLCVRPLAFFRHVGSFSEGNAAYRLLLDAAKANVLTIPTELRQAEGTRGWLSPIAGKSLLALVRSGLSLDEVKNLTWGHVGWLGEATLVWDPQIELRPWRNSDGTWRKLPITKPGWVPMTCPEVHQLWVDWGSEAAQGLVFPWDSQALNRAIADYSLELQPTAPTASPPQPKNGDLWKNLFQSEPPKD